jgi:hypothetical protein
LVSNSNKLGRIGEIVYFSSETNIFTFDGTAITDTGISATYEGSRYHYCSPVNDVLYCTRYSPDVEGNYIHYTFDGSVFEGQPVAELEGIQPVQQNRYCASMAGKSLFLVTTSEEDVDLYTFDGSDLTRVRTLELGESEEVYGGGFCFGQQGEETYLTTIAGSGTYNRYLMDIEGNLSLVEEDSISLRSELYFGEVDGVQYYSGYDEFYNVVYYSFVDGETTLLSDWIVEDTFPDLDYDAYGYMSLIPHCHGMC